MGGRDNVGERKLKSRNFKINIHPSSHFLQEKLIRISGCEAYLFKTKHNTQKVKKEKRITTLGSLLFKLSLENREG